MPEDLCFRLWNVHNVHTINRQVPIFACTICHSFSVWGFATSGQKRARERGSGRANQTEIETEEKRNMNSNCSNSWNYIVRCMHCIVRYMEIRQYIKSNAGYHTLFQRVWCVFFFTMIILSYVPKTNQNKYELCRDEMAAIQAQFNPNTQTVHQEKKIEQAMKSHTFAFRSMRYMNDM